MTWTTPQLIAQLRKIRENCEFDRDDDLLLAAIRAEACDNVAALDEAIRRIEEAGK